MTAHDCNVEARGPLGVFLVFDADLLQSFYYIKVATVHCIVQTVEALRVNVVHSLTETALHKQAH